MEKKDLTANESTYIERLAKTERRDNEYVLERDNEIEQSVIEQVLNGYSVGVKLA